MTHKYSHRNKSRRHRGGAGAPNPSSYSSASSYGMAVNGAGQSQFNRVFDINGPDGKSNSNTIVGLQGQKAGSRKRRSSSRNKKGGLWGTIINQAIVPFSILGMQQSFRRKSNKHGGRKTRKHR